MRTVFTAKYKDSSRYWWRLDVWQTGESVGDEGEDYLWGYRLTNEHMGDIDLSECPPALHEGEIAGQYNEIPRVDEFLLDYLSYLNAVVVGFSRHGRFLPTYPLSMPADSPPTIPEGNQ